MLWWPVFWFCPQRSPAMFPPDEPQPWIQSRPCGRIKRERLDLPVVTGVAASMPACRYFLCAIGLLSGHHDILEHCRTVGRFRHYRELKTTLGTRFRKYLLLLMQI